MMTGKGKELADMMHRRKVEALFVQETRWKSSKARSTGAEFKKFYHDVDRKTNRVSVILKEEHSKNVVEVTTVSDSIMSVRVEIKSVMINVVSGLCHTSWL